MNFCGQQRNLELKSNKFTPLILYAPFANHFFISTSSKNFLMSRIDFTVLLLFEFLKKHHLRVGQVKNRILYFTSPIAKSTSPWLSDTTFFACCVCIT